VRLELSTRVTMQIALFRDVMTGSLAEISEESAAHIFTTIKNREKSERKIQERGKCEEGPKRATLESNHCVITPEESFLRSFSVRIRGMRYF